MEKEYKVYPDKVREGISLAVYSFFILAMLSVFFFASPHIILMPFLVIFIVLMALMIAGTVKKIGRNNLLYLFNEDGITDYSQKEHIIHLSWQEIARIEMVPNNSSLQIGILGSKVFAEQEAVSQNVRENLMRNGNFVFYNIIIDGFLFRKKKFKEIFNSVTVLAQEYNTSIVINEYKDPLARKKIAQK